MINILKVSCRCVMSLLVVLLLASCSQPDDPLSAAPSNAPTIEVPDVGAIDNPYKPISCEDDPNQSKCEQSCTDDPNQAKCVTSCKEDANQSFCGELCEADSSQSFCDEVCEDDTVTHSFCDPIEECTVDNALGNASCLQQCEDVGSGELFGFCEVYCPAGSSGPVPSFCETYCPTNGSGSIPSYCSSYCEPETGNMPSYCETICINAFSDGSSLPAHCTSFCPADDSGPVPSFCESYCPTNGSGDIPSYCDNYCEISSGDLPSFCQTICINLFGDGSDTSVVLPGYCSTYCPDDGQGLPAYCVGYYCKDGSTHGFCPTIECTLENALDNAECQVQCSNSGTNLPDFCQVFCPTPEGDLPNFCQAYCPINGSAGAAFCQQICTVQFNSDGNVPTFCQTYCPEGSASGSVPNFCDAICDINPNHSFCGQEVSCDENSDQATCVTSCLDNSTQSFCIEICRNNHNQQFCPDICTYEDGYQFCDAICNEDENFLFCEELQSCEDNADQDKCVVQCAVDPTPDFCDQLCNNQPDLIFCLGNDPSAFTVKLAAVQRLNFNWRPVAGKTYDNYEISGVFGGKEIVNRVISKTNTGTNINAPMFDPSWTDALYILRGCSQGNCEDIGQAALFQKNNLLKGIGYFKSTAVTAYSGQEYGSGVVLSGDGNSMAVTGSKLSSSDPEHSGVVHLYRRDSVGTWRLKNVVKPLTDPADPAVMEENDNFGRSVSLSDDGKVVAIGYPGYNFDSLVDSEDKVNTGAVLIYRYDETSEQWKRVPGLLRTELALRQANSEYGYGVSLNSDGTKLAVGAPGQFTTKDVPNRPRTGVVFVLDVDINSDNLLGSFGQQHQIAFDGIWDGERYGTRVSLSGSGNRLAAGAPNGGSNVSSDKNGRVDIYIKTTGGWINDDFNGDSSTQHLVLNSADGSGIANSLFGVALSFSGDGKTLAVGARNFSEGQGRIYIYRLQEDRCANKSICNNWSTLVNANLPDPIMKATLSASNEASGGAQQFGIAVSLNENGTRLAVSANRDSGVGIGVLCPGCVLAGEDTDSHWSGTAYVFDRLPETSETPTAEKNRWVRRSIIKASNPGRNDKFGNSLSLSGDGRTLAIGSPFEDRYSDTVVSSGEDSRQPETNPDGYSDAGAVYMY